MNFEEAQEELNKLKLRYQTGEFDLDRLIDLCYQIGTKVNIIKRR